MNLVLSQFQDHHADEVAGLIRRNLLEVNSPYYSAGYIASIIDHLAAPRLIEIAKTEYILVAIENDKVVGTGTLSDFGSAEAPSYYGTSIFVAIEYHRKGLGKQIMHAIENKVIELGGNKLIVRAARNARLFYEKLGYQYQSGTPEEDERGNYIMEKALP